MERKPDCSGWATRYNIKCADGRTLKNDAFKDCDGKRVPLVWGHIHNDPSMVLGHAILSHRKEGVWCDCYFNKTEKGLDSKEAVHNGDITSYSIYADRLKEDTSRNVYHGIIREVSLVLGGANPGALVIQHELCHSDDDPDNVAAIIYGPVVDILIHSDESATEENQNENENSTEKEENAVENENKLEHAEENENKLEHAEENKPDDQSGEGPTVQDVLDTMNEDQKKATMILMGEAYERGKNEKSEDNKEDTEMSHNVFENENENENVLTHDEELALFKQAQSQRVDSLREFMRRNNAGDVNYRDCLAHSITNIGYLYPDAKTLDKEPSLITRETSWVGKVLGAVKHTPFAKIRSLHANLTADEARAKGYPVKGEQKVEEVIAMLQRTTSPTTVYKLQKLDRDDMIDITDYDVVAFLKKEMRFMLDEELARAILISDGRASNATDRIKRDCLRPIWGDDPTYVVYTPVVYEAADTEATKLDKFITAAIKSRKYYRGTGKPVLFTTEDMLDDLLLMKDSIGRRLYNNENDVAVALRVSEIITVPVMDNQVRAGSGDNTGYDFKLLGIIVNLVDYNVGADKGGEINLFDDFDIDFNKYTYLIETRISGALVKPYSAICIENKYEHVAG